MRRGICMELWYGKWRTWLGIYRRTKILNFLVFFSFFCFWYLNWSLTSANSNSSSSNSCLWAGLGKWGPFLSGLPFIVGGLVLNLGFLLSWQMSTGESALTRGMRAFERKWKYIIMSLLQWGWVPLNWQRCDGSSVSHGGSTFCLSFFYPLPPSFSLVSSPLASLHLFPITHHLYTPLVA